MEDWRERLRDLYLEENSEITSPNSILFNWGEFLFKGKAYQNFYLATQDSIEEFIEQELSKAREEGYADGVEHRKRRAMKYFMDGKVGDDLDLVEYADSTYKLTTK